MKRYEKYDFDEFADYFSGPDAFMLTDELTAAMHLTPEMKVLDLGCGNALSSLFLVKEYGCKVYAVDPRSASSNNYDLAVKYQVADKLIPFCAVADRLPFAPDSFDAMICINAWQAFGTAPGFFTAKIAPYLKKGAQIGIVTPAVTAAYESESRIDQQDVLATYWSARRWGDFFRNEFDVKEVKEMDSTVEAWKRWYRAASPAARRDETAKWDIGNTIAIAMVTGIVR